MTWLSTILTELNEDFSGGMGHIYKSMQINACTSIMLKMLSSSQNVYIVQFNKLYIIVYFQG